MVGEVQQRVGYAEDGPLSRAEWCAAHEVIRWVHAEVAAELMRVVLFGSKARGDDRPDSDVDLLLIFRALPPDREPQATHAEEIAAAVAERTGVPVTTWSVSLIDLEVGQRTPMLVDALEDGIPLWPCAAPPLRVEFTPWDALCCARALFDRLEEGSAEIAEWLRFGEEREAARRVRDDVVRLCTAALLLEGETRPRRGAVVRRFAEVYGCDGLPAPLPEVLRWAAASFGSAGRDENRPVGLPAGGFPVAFAALRHMRERIGARARELQERVYADGTPAPRAAYET